MVAAAPEGLAGMSAPWPPVALGVGSLCAERGRADRSPGCVRVCERGGRPCSAVGRRETHTEGP